MSESVTKVLNQSSLEVAKNTRGFTWTVKAYAATVEGIERVTRELIGLAERIVKDFGEAEAQ